MLETLSNYYRYGDTKNPKVVYSGPADVMGSDGSKSEEDIATESQYCHVIPGLEDGVDKARVIKVSPDQSQVRFFLGRATAEMPGGGSSN